MQMKYLGLIGLLVVMGASAEFYQGEDFVAVSDEPRMPETPAPYGLTWHQYRKIQATAILRRNRFDMGHAREEIQMAIDNDLGDEKIGFAEMIFTSMAEANARDFREERERVGEFCAEVDALESPATLLDPYVAAGLADTYPRIAKAELLLTANGITDEIGTPFMRENYPGLWLINKAWVYCRVKI